MYDVSAMIHGLVYLDNNATTACYQAVVESMMPYWTQVFGNTESIHQAGRKASGVVEQCREDIAVTVRTRPHQIFFTSGATEGNNFIFSSYARTPAVRKRVAVSAIEHKSVLKAAEALAPLGFDVVKLPVNTDGIVDVDKARMLIDDSIGLVSVQLANNETGVLQPVRDLVELAHEHGAYFHCDAVQALGKMTIDLQELGVDSASFSAHKIHGPKGVGFIYIASGSMKFPFVFAYKGGGQEHGLRPGTVNVPGIVGMATAMRMLPSDAKIHEMSGLLRRFELGLVASGLPCVFHGDRAERLPNTSNFALCGIPADMLIANLPTLCISTGSACNSQEVAPSDVLKAMGVSDDEALSSIRVSLSTQTTEEEIDYAIMEISRATSRLKELLS